MFKKRKNGIGVNEEQSHLPDKVHEVTADEEYYFCWETPAKSSQPILIQHVKKTSGVFEYKAAFDTWANRTTATYVPWSQRSTIIQ